MPLSLFELIIYIAVIGSMYAGPLFAILSLMLIFTRITKGKWKVSRGFLIAWITLGMPVFIVIAGAIVLSLQNKALSIESILYILVFVSTSILLGKGFFSATKSASKALLAVIPTCLIIGVIQATLANEIFFNNKIPPIMVLFGFPVLYAFIAIIAVIGSATKQK